MFAEGALSITYIPKLVHSLEKVSGADLTDTEALIYAHGLDGVGSSRPVINTGSSDEDCEILLRGRLLQ